MKYRLDIPVDASPAGHHLLQLNLEQMLLSEPEEIVLALGSRGPMDAHSALSYVRLLGTRNPAKTKIVTLARGGMFDTELLIWLSGDERDMPPDAWLYIRSLKAGKTEFGSLANGSYSATEQVGDPTPTKASMEAFDHLRVLSQLNEYLATSELFDRFIAAQELEDLCLFGVGARVLDSLLLGPGTHSSPIVKNRLSNH